MAREEVEAGDSGGPINITPASRAGLRAEAGEKVGVFVFDIVGAVSEGSEGHRRPNE